jgi:hypothetical protein
MVSAAMEASLTSAAWVAKYWALYDPICALRMTLLRLTCEHTHSSSLSQALVAAKSDVVTSQYRDLKATIGPERETEPTSGSFSTKSVHAKMCPNPDMSACIPIWPTELHCHIEL